MYIAAKAIDELNSTPLNGKRIRISYSILDATLRKNGAGNLYVKVIYFSTYDFNFFFFFFLIII